MQWVKQGWSSMLRQFSSVLLLFVYQLIWGLLLYRFIESIVYPLLRRYPGNSMQEQAVQLFFIEGQFQLTRTDISHRYLAILAALVLLRLVVSPLIQAGICHCIHQAGSKEKRVFLTGVKTYGVFFVLLYWLQLTLTLLPAYWILPRTADIYNTNVNWQPMLMELSPLALLWILYAFLLHLLFLSVQIGKVSGRPAFHSLGVGLRSILPFSGVASVLLLASGAVFLVTAAVSLIWAGLLALILHQIHYLIRTMFKVWGITSQYHLWRFKSGE
ncbi:hypothetical protein [Paenibacillus gansuensis]|uniref:Uncharacterized protein n=1 Tax=Paenibacillus gansuensis TaxID=306542 RepID=A0ABW5PHZ8_9BACL